ncbi:zinc finger protein-like 1 [Corvus moneduloides]|uniref:zinc finger protein-like 1 n=1 Tax=Corvus moneduloides TaxID=1196302 RepID=UPI0013626288|nr:zinc finger protein-like 1 [Corvus moneduloides]
MAIRTDGSDVISPRRAGTRWAGSSRHLGCGGFVGDRPHFRENLHEVTQSRSDVPGSASGAARRHRNVLAMGLCKCPKRRVTTLFCFEHRVNVCESCLVSAHPKCIVRSYLQWLQDSDYSPQCPLCEAPLGERETVRLVCYDVFHWPCLAGWARALPPRTAPAGHRCPQCGGPLFPPPNLEGPVAEALRARLRTAPWARPGLGLPLIEDSEELPEPETAQEPDRGWDAPITPPEPAQSPPPPHAVVHMGGETPTLHPGSAPRKPLGGRESRSPPDRDEDKYRRRPLAWVPPKFRCRMRGAQRRPLLVLCLGGAAAFALLLLLLASLGRGGADSDPALEPLNNPHVRVGH